MKLFVLFVLCMVIVGTTGKNNMEAFRAYLRLVEEQMERDSEHDTELKNWGYYYGPLRGTDGTTAASSTMCLVAPKEDDKTKAESESSDKEISTPTPTDPGWREASPSNVDEERTQPPAMVQTRTVEPSNVGWNAAMTNYNGRRNPVTSNNVGWRAASSSNNGGWGTVKPNTLGWRTAAPSHNAVRSAPLHSGWKASASSPSGSRSVPAHNNGWRAAAPSVWSYAQSSPHNNYGGWGWSPNEHVASGWNRGWNNPGFGHNFRQISQVFNSGWASRGHHGFGEAPQASGWTKGCVCKAAGVQSNVG